MLMESCSHLQNSEGGSLEVLTLNIFDTEQDSTGRRSLRDFTNKSRYAHTDAMGRKSPCKQFINYYCGNSTLSLFSSSAKSRTNLEVSVKYTQMV